MVDVVVLGASPNNGPLREVSAAPAEALIKIGDKHMVAYVLEALLKAQTIGKIVLVGSEQALSDFNGDRVKVTPGGSTAIGSLIKGLVQLPSSTRVLVATADIPLITPEAIDGFINSCDEDNDFFYPIVSRESIIKYYPGIKRTYVNFREGVFTGGNLFLINPKIVQPCAICAEEMVRLRKSPFKLAQLLGIGFIFKFLTRRLRLPEVEQKVSELLRIKGKAIITPYPEIGIDVDKPSDYKLVKHLLGK